MKIAVLGAGAWGTAISISLSRQHDVTLWARSPKQAESMRVQRTNARYLPEQALPSGIDVVADLGFALAHAELVLVATDTAGLREVLRRTRDEGSSAFGVILLCKGFERGSALLPHQVCSEELRQGSVSGALSGPSFAQEVARNLPTAVTLASSSAQFAREAAIALHSPALRVYSTTDVMGVEVAGAVKNVIAIAVGISDGLEYGHNARAALITRGLAEIARLGIALGGHAETFMGLSGAGDLILTCTGDLSRNRQVGLGLARGDALSDILRHLGHVAEGVNTAREVERLARRLSIDMPITRAVCRVLRDHTRARAEAEELLRREPKSERLS